jgi:PAS domain S-box-containing protein
LKDAQLLEMLKHSIDIHYDAAFWTTPEGEFVYVNDTACTSLGYDRDELMCLRIWNINPIVNLNPEKWSDVWNRLREQKTIHIESIHVRKDGTEFPVEIVSTYVQFGDQEYNCGFARDISERKQAEDALKRAEEAKLGSYKALEASQTLYRTTIDAIDHAIHVVDKDLKILVANKELEQWAEKYNFEKEFVGKTVLEAFPFLPSRVEEEYKTVFATGKPYITEDSNIHNPHGMYTETRKYPVFEGDRVTRIVTSVENISERKMSEKVIIESEEKFRTITEQSALGIIIATGSKITYVNDMACSILNVKRNRFIDSDIKSIRGIIHPDDVLLFDTLMEIMDSGSGDFQPPYILRLNIKPGDEKWIEIFAKLIKFENEFSMLAIVNDITEPTKKKNALQESELRVREMQEEEITKLRNIEQLRTEFTLRVAHELRTPLTSICSAMDILPRFFPHSSDQAKELIKIVQKGGERLMNLVNNLVDSFRVGADAMELRKEYVNLVDLIVNVVDQSKFFLNQRRHRMILDLPEFLDIEIDKERIEAVLSNLITNAIYNTPPGGEIFIQLRVLGDNIELSIKDSGVGLIDEEMARIFTKFGKIERYGKGIDLVTEGSGLGLYISKNVVELHGGTIRAESEGRNKGSTFIVKLPLQQI